MKSLVRVVARYLIVLFAEGLVPFSSYATVQTMLPDFYAEPGLNPFRGRVAANVNERIDTFNGSLNITHTDLVIPGELIQYLPDSPAPILA